MSPALSRIPHPVPSSFPRVLSAFRQPLAPPSTHHLLLRRSPAPSSSLSYAFSPACLSRVPRINMYAGNNISDALALVAASGGRQAVLFRGERAFARQDPGVSYVTAFLFAGITSSSCRGNRSNSRNGPMSPSSAVHGSTGVASGTPSAAEHDLVRSWLGGRVGFRRRVRRNLVACEVGSRERTAGRIGCFGVAVLNPFSAEKEVPMRE